MPRFCGIMLFMVVAINNTLAHPPPMATTEAAGSAFYGVIYHAELNGKAYIGQTRNFAARQRTHKSGSDCRYWSSAIKKHGADNIRWRIIGYAVNQAALDEAEIFAIAHYRTMSPNGYNLKAGGGGGGSPSLETRARMSARAKEFLAIPENRERMITSLRGRKLTEAHKAAISAGGKRRAAPSAETRKKLSAWQKGRKLSPEHIEKMRSVHIGRKQSPQEIAKRAAKNKGQKRTAEQRARFVVAQKRRRAAEKGRLFC